MPQDKYVIRCSDGTEEELDARMTSDGAALSKTLTRACDASEAKVWELFYIANVPELLARVSRFHDRSITVTEVSI